jgi:hypothetical protein
MGRPDARGRVAQALVGLAALAALAMLSRSTPRDGASA